MKTKRVTFIIEFEEPQDVEVDCNNLNDVYLALDALLHTGVISDYNSSEMTPELCETCKDMRCAGCSVPVEEHSVCDQDDPCRNGGDGFTSYCKKHGGKS